MWNLVNKQDRKEVVSLVKFIDKTVSNYIWPNWCIDEATQIITIEFLFKGSNHFKLWIITLSLEKVKQINSVIKTGQFEPINIVKKIERDYSIYKESF